MFFLNLYLCFPTEETFRIEDHDIKNTSSTLYLQKQFVFLHKVLSIVFSRNYISTNEPYCHLIFLSISSKLIIVACSFHLNF